MVAVLSLSVREDHTGKTVPELIAPLLFESRACMNVYRDYKIRDMIKIKRTRQNCPARRSCKSFLFCFCLNGHLTCTFHENDRKKRRRNRWVDRHDLDDLSVDH